MWNSIKVWFNKSEVLLFARFQMLAGLVVAAASSMDWSSLIAGIHTGLTWVQGAVLGCVLFAQGLITEVARRINTKEVAGYLVPKEIVVDIPKTEEKIKEA